MPNTQPIMQSASPSQLLFCRHSPSFDRTWPLTARPPARPSRGHPAIPIPRPPCRSTTPLSTAKPDDKQVPEANPARPTVTNPAHIPPVGYLQFEQGFLYATASPGGVAHQLSVVQTTKLAVHPRLMFQVLSQPFAATRLINPDEPETSSRDTGRSATRRSGTPAPRVRSPPYRRARL